MRVCLEEDRKRFRKEGSADPHCLKFFTHLLFVLGRIALVLNLQNVGVHCRAHLQIFVLLDLRSSVIILAGDAGHH
jgi:hypothetical protein